MITAKRIITLSETWIKSGRVGNVTVNVYENPNKIEILKLFRESITPSWQLRFIADANSQKIYAWDAYLSVHVDILKLLGISTFFINTPNILLGLAFVSKDGSMRFGAWSSFKYLDSFVDKKAYIEYYNKVFEYNWSFMDRYVTGFSTALGKEKETFERNIKQTLLLTKRF